ncbi:sigma factor [Novosphingobium taihuense]|uniref:RNA polymerase sigma-70 factor (ECF subfamily) n=1 Tax=Novosphingobium taihuense TaxID=260085 RepID=A0A7W7ET94_9SPHN|nr:sigma factor-like helix-turn-helix DNA-binding protein [Novosphingobium taihuense]MBB4613022.1 RNA polymerase sigma-70 factor (ECF subfamily) [Novosphingobium taihuense]TWH85166.1 RNA polymerase sigma-70 factor (ECF subfamily) [Novosphingobium taihuense]
MQTQNFTQAGAWTGARSAGQAAGAIAVRRAGTTAAGAHRGGFDWDGAMAASLAGDAAAYHMLLARSARWLRQYYARRLPYDTIDDVVQETLLAVHSRKASFIPGRPYLPWLAAIARYKWVDAIRSGKRQPTEELVEVPTGSHEDSVLAAFGLHGLMSNLRAAQAEAIRLVKIEGCSILEASRISGQSESLVKVNIHRGLIALRRLLNADVVGPRMA